MYLVVQRKQKLDLLVLSVVPIPEPLPKAEHSPVQTCDVGGPSAKFGETFFRLKHREFRQLHPVRMLAVVALLVVLDEGFNPSQVHQGFVRQKVKHQEMKH